MLIAQQFTQLLFAAASSPDAAFTGNATVFVASIIVPILGLGLSALVIFLGNKRTPPIGEEMHKTFVSKDEHDANIQRLHSRVDKLTEDQSSARMVFSKAFGDLEHAIGRLEGRLNDKS